jgi:predicted metal-dependent hydrolase
MTDETASTVHPGGTAIPYAIRRSARRKTIAITVDPDAGVVLTAPHRVSLSHLERIVHERRDWIVEKLRSFEDARRRHPRPRFVSGEPFLFLGQSLPLCVTEGAASAAPAFGGDELRVTVPAGLAEGPRSDVVRAKLEGWFRQQALWCLPGRVAFWHEFVEVPMPRVMVKYQQRRWGSCDARGTLRLNWRLVQAPPALIDYVVVHELVHLRHRGHQRDFWHAVNAVMPDYGWRRRQLNELGDRLDW